MSPRRDRTDQTDADQTADEQTTDEQAADEQSTADEQATADAAPSLCGKPVVKKDKDGNAQKYTAENVTEGHAVGDEITMPCIKAAGHDKDAKSKHSWRAYTKVDTSVISLDDVNTFESVPTDEVVESVREQEDSDVQKAINEQVIAAYRKWVAVGRPKTWGEAIKKGAVAKYRVTPENQAAWRSMLRIGATRTADRSDVEHVSVRIHPKIKKMVDGSYQLWWYAVEHRTRDNSGESGESSESAQTDA